MLLLAALLVAAWPAWPLESQDSGLKPGPQAKVQSVIDGDTLLLENGRELRLVGIQAPKLPLGRAGFKPWPLAEESKSYLAHLVENKELKIFFGQAAQDRHGRILGHAYLPDGGWVQQDMLRAGLARVYTFADNRALAAELLSAEREARKKNAGIWADEYYAIRKADRIGREDYDSFQLVEGVVRDVAEVKKVFYLNFGADWKSDFTAQIPFSARKLFSAAKIKPKDLKGKPVRVRGWVYFKNGAMIDLTHPEQLEILAP